MTQREAEALTFITSYTAAHNGLSPSHQEIADALGLGSKSGAHRLTVSLLRQGRIRRSALFRGWAVVSGAADLAQASDQALLDKLRRRGLQGGVAA